MIIPFGSTGGRQLTRTEDESKGFSCNSSGGVEGPEGESWARSVIIQKSVLTAAECILSRWRIWHVCGPSVSLCPHHLGTTARGQLGQGGNRLWLRWQKMASESTTGWMLLITRLKKKSSDLFFTPAWLTDRGRAPVTPGYVLTASSAKH